MASIDIKGLSYLSSMGIRILLRAAKKAKADRKIFAICRAEGFVKEVIEESEAKTQSWGGNRVRILNVDVVSGCSCSLRENEPLAFF